MAMSETCQENCRYFVTYTGVKLPFKLINPLSADEVRNRNTFLRAWFDGEERLIGFQKVTYGETEMEHRYEYHDNGALRQATITDVDEEVTVLSFDGDGKPLAM